MTGSYLVVLADDHALFRQGIRRILGEMPGIEVVGEAGDGLELVNLLKTVTPHLVILDISMPHLRGLEAVREIKLLHPAAKVLILTMHKEKDYLYHALKVGAEGYLLKEDADSELLAAIQMIRQGKNYLSPLLAVQFQDLILHQGVPSASPGILTHLTHREREILKLIVEGKSSREIGDLLFISPRTVQHHRANIMKKLHVKKTTDLIKYALQQGYA